MAHVWSKLAKVRRVLVPLRAAGATTDLRMTTNGRILRSARLLLARPPPHQDELEQFVLMTRHPLGQGATRMFIGECVLFAQATELAEEISVLAATFRRGWRRVRPQPGACLIIELADVRRPFHHFGVGRPLLFEVVEVTWHMAPAALMSPRNQIVGRIEIRH